MLLKTGAQYGSQYITWNKDYHAGMKDIFSKMEPFKINKLGTKIANYLKQLTGIYLTPTMIRKLGETTIQEKVDDGTLSSGDQQLFTRALAHSNTVRDRNYNFATPNVARIRSAILEKVEYNMLSKKQLLFC